jgi:hypothetical protein
MTVTIVNLLRTGERVWQRASSLVRKSSALQGRHKNVREKHTVGRFDS